MIIVVLAAVICFESWAIHRLTENVETLKEQVSEMKDVKKALEKDLKFERDVNASLLQGQVFSEQRPYRNWFYPTIGEDTNEGA